MRYDRCLLSALRDLQLGRLLLMAMCCRFNLQPLAVMVDNGYYQPREESEFVENVPEV
jgi:hypothetical protein